MFYQPGALPADPALLADALRSELARLALVLSQPAPSLSLDTLYTAPKRITEGMVVKADGVAWNPGTGAGIYARTGGAWVKL